MENTLNKGFEFNGVWIEDPNYDETGRFEVDPKTYYKQEYEFEFNFYNNDEPRYILHDVDYFDSTMLHMLVEFKVHIANIKDWKITKL